MSDFSTASKVSDFQKLREKARKILKLEDTNSRIISGNPVFLPLDADRMGSIAEEQSDLGINYDRLSLRNLARIRHNSSMIETHSQVSKHEPMIK